MKKQIKRITAFAAAVAMATTFTFPAEIGDSFFGFGNVIVASAESSGEWVYTVNADQTVTITGYQGWGGAVEIPAVIDGKSVTSIGNGAFRNCPGLESITIPYTVTSIGDYAFESCTGLKRITIPDGVTSIGINAFMDCYSLTSITIPDGVTSIGTNAFYGCSGLTSITVDSSNSSYCSESGVLFNKNKTALICYPAGKTDSSYKIPDEVTSIEYAAFEACTGLTSITIGGGVTSIGDYAFESCTGLESITIPDSVNSIGYAAFNYCTGLTSIYIPDGISIGQHAIPSTAARITYIVNSDGSVTITKIELTNGQNTIDIPAAIDGKKVTAVSENYQNFVGTHAHVLNKTEAVAHTCTADGTIAYWECSVCGNKFSDDNGTTEITDIANPNDPAPGHKWDTAYDSNETHHWHNCTNANCPITENNQKDGYAIHTCGADWESDNDENHYHACSKCGDKIDVTAHSYDSGVITTPAT